MLVYFAILYHLLSVDDWAIVLIILFFVTVFILRIYFQSGMWANRHDKYEPPQRVPFLLKKNKTWVDWLIIVLSFALPVVFIITKVYL